MKRITSILLLLLLVTTCFAGCQPNGQATNPNNEKGKSAYPNFVLSSTDETVTYLNVDGEEITVNKKPEKTVVLLNSILDLWYLAGGESVARVKGTVNVPTEALDLPILGSFATVSAESIIALEPDLVLLSSNSSSHKKLYKILKENGIQCAPIDTGTQPYHAFQKNLYLMTEILGTQDIYQNEIKNILEDCNEIIETTKSQKEKPSVAVLYVTSKSMKTETQFSLTGEMLSLLGANNIIKLDEIPVDKSTRVDFSLEILASRDPDYILFCTMGDIDACKDKVKKDLESSEVFKNIKAVKNGNVHFLPKENFVYKPNGKYPEALKQLANIVYPNTIK